MGFKRETLAEAVSKLRSNGIDGVIIGSTVYMIYLKLKEFEDDIDIFTTTISPTFDEDIVRDAAGKLKCLVGQTEWGTPQLRCHFRGDEVTIELHENIYDFYIPSEMIEDARTVSIGSVDIKILRLEDYLVLKAKAGRDADFEDLRFLADLISSKDLSISVGKIIDRLNLFDEYEAKLIKKRLKEAGLKI